MNIISLFSGCGGLVWDLKWQDLTFQVANDLTIKYGLHIKLIIPLLI